MKKSRWFSPVLALLLLAVTITVVSALTYRVTWGDTLTNIANRFGTSISTILQANPQISNPNLIFVGQELEIPTGDTTTSTPTPPPVNTPTPVPPGTTPTPPPTGSQTYIVRSGDTLSAIARRFNTTVSAIAQASGINNINYIYVGQVLTIPGSGPLPTSPPPNASGFALGAQTLNLNNKDRLEEAGMAWIKFQYKWAVGNSVD